MTTAARWTTLAIVGLIALLAWAYWPGLSGSFLFDDNSNLDVLGAYGRIDNWRTFLFYITSGTADPTGRPVALLTFLLDAQTWPATPWPFKRTNLILHLLNTALLALAVTRLQAGLQRRQPALPTSPWTPVFAAALWGAHPFFVSTVLYVVQREAMLPMTFVLLGLLAWDRAVLDFARQRNAAGWSWAVFGLGSATLLGALSKANGLLAPLLIGLAYAWFLRPTHSADSHRWRQMDHAALVCLALPTLGLLAYLLHHGWQLWSLPYLPGRDWTLSQRLLSEPRVLWSYVGQLLIPRAGGGGIYVEDFVASRGWLQPVTTLPALLALLASVVAALMARRRLPILCFAWLFFLAAHLMEGTTVALELYFEHRNYLPAMFLGWPLAHALLRPGAYTRYRAALVTLLLAAFLLLTCQRASTWGDPQLFGALSAAHETDSARAQVSAARQQIERGDVQAGLARIRATQEAQPESVDVAISRIGMECGATGTLGMDTLARARHALATARRWNYGLYDWMQDGARDTGLRACHGFGLPGLTALVDAAESNPQSAGPSRKRDLWHVRGRIALAQADPDAALRWFDAAVELKPDPEYALTQAAALGNAGAPALGVRHLDHYALIETTAPAIQIRNMSSAHAWLLRHYGYYHKELSYLRQQLQSDAGSSAARIHDDGR